MKKFLLIQVLFCLSLHINAQTEVSVSQDYVLDAETGQLIQVVSTSSERTVVVNEVPTQQVVVVDDRTSFEKGVDTVLRVAAVSAVVGGVVHAIKHHHHHHHYCPPVPPRPVYGYHHHHHQRPSHRPHHRW